MSSVAKVPDFRPAPNQGGNVELYEVENGALGLSYSYSLHSIDKPDGLLRAR
jgi:hypothetical protein